MILINGCSHTYGTDINQNMGWAGLYKIFATKPVVNLAKEGCSNQYMCRTTIEWCRENLKNQTDFALVVPKGSLSVFQIYLNENKTA